MFRFQWHNLLLVTAVIALAFGAAPAQADVMFNLTTGNSDISGFTGPYASVDVHLVNSTNATITFDSLTNSGNIYLLGDGGTVGVNVNATSWTVGGISGTNAGTGFTPGPFSDGGSGNEDGFGSFNQNINSFDGYTHSSDHVTFTLTDTGGTWASAADVLTNNASGNKAAAHIFVTTSPALASGFAIVTGFAANGPGTGVIPEPASIVVWGLLGIVGLAYRLRRRHAA
jgi:hypothetical protein